MTRTMTVTAALAAIASAAHADFYEIGFESIGPGTELTSSMEFNGNANASFDSRLYVNPDNPADQYPIYSTVEDSGLSGALSGNTVRSEITGNRTIGAVDFVPIFQTSFYLGSVAIGHDATQAIDVRATVFGNGGSILSQQVLTIPAGEGGGEISTVVFDFTPIQSKAVGFALQNINDVQLLDNHFYWDNVVYGDDPVPAPATGALLSFGALAFTRRRRAR